MSERESWTASSYQAQGSSSSSNWRTRGGGERSERRADAVPSSDRRRPGQGQGGGSGAKWVPVNASPAEAVDSAQENRRPEGSSKAKGKGKGKGKSERKASGGKGGRGGKAPRGGDAEDDPGGGIAEASVDASVDGVDVASETAQVPRPSRRARGEGRAGHLKDTAATVAERLAEQLGRGSYDCMICISKVARGQPIWSCDQCWAAFHLKCINLWVRRSSDSGGPEFAWACPGCRYHRIGPMPRYTCFCSKAPEPDQNPHFLAHSCGDVCEKDRGCPHHCPELCHPGPCPRCTAVGGPGSCYCGREASETTRCGDPPKWSCKTPCDRALSCGLHSCPARCHPGPCPPCATTSLVSCHCGAKEEERLCGYGPFSCQNTCGRLLDCEEHRCSRPCHPGDCGTCPLEPQRWGDRCACGKTESCSREGARTTLVRWVAPRERCVDPLPLCGELCGRSSESCGHGCRKFCHEGQCGTCAMKVQRECRCARTRREVACSGGREVLCVQVCRTKKTCGNHKCDAVCCPGFNNRNHEAHFCLQMCAKPLGCGNHVCEDFCHLGKCPPCRVVLHEPLYCACGKSSIEPPVVCGMSPPICDSPCGSLMDCGHDCPARCHPGEHPLCYELVARQCLGGHREMRNQRCHIGANSCGQPCGQRLPCGHGCSAQCHAGDCPPCSQPCGSRRPHCEHHCEAPCHPAVPECEDVPCRRKMKQACPCGLRVEERLCGAFSGAQRPQHGPLRCLATCDRSAPASAPTPGGKGGSGAVRSSVQQSEPAKYAADLHQLAFQHRRYVQTLEESFSAILTASAAKGPGSVNSPCVLPACDTARRLLAVEYARLHWRLKTSSKADSSEGWWVVQVTPSPGAQPPRPLLSEIAASSGASAAGNLLPALGSQPCLRFLGLKGPGDEVYDLLGDLPGLLGLRPGCRTGEVIAFVDRSGTAAAAFRRLTGQATGSEPTPLRSSPGGWTQGTQGGQAASSIRVVLEQTLGSTPGSAGLAAKPSFEVPAGGDGWDSKDNKDHPEELHDVPDSWED